MPGGTEFQEAAEVPQETREVSEVKEQLDRAAFEPEAAVEQTGDFKGAEAVLDAFIDSIPLTNASQESTRVEISTPPSESASEGVAPSAPPAGIQSLSGISKTESDSEGAKPGEIQSLSELSQTESFSESMEGAKPGEIKGLVNENNDVVYEFSGDGSETPQDLTERVIEKEGQTVEAEVISTGSEASKIPDSLVETQGTEEAGESPAVSPVGANEFIVSDQMVEEQLPQSAAGDEELSPVTRKTLGYTSVSTGGLDLDDEPGSGDSTGEENETPEDADSRTDSYSQEITGATPGEVRGFEEDEGRQETVETSAEDGLIDFTGTTQNPEDLALQNNLQQQSRQTPMISNVMAEAAEEQTNTIVNIRGEEGSDIQSTADVVEEMEEKLNEIGDDAQLANIEMQNASQRLGQLTGMLSSISKALEDNPISDIRKVSGGGDSGSLDSSESSGDQPEGTTNPAIEAQAAAMVEEVLAAETPEDAAALVQSVLRESYMENSQDLAFYANKVKYFNECKKQVRNYVAELRNSINTISEGEDGTQIEEKAQDLNEADSQGSSEGSESPYQLVEGSILVGEAVIDEPAGDANGDDDEEDSENNEDDDGETSGITGDPIESGPTQSSPSGA